MLFTAIADTVDGVVGGAVVAVVGSAVVAVVGVVAIITADVNGGNRILHVL